MLQKRKVKLNYYFHVAFFLYFSQNNFMYLIHLYVQKRIIPVRLTYEKITEKVFHIKTRRTEIIIFIYLKFKCKYLNCKIRILNTAHLCLQLVSK